MWNLFTNSTVTSHPIGGLGNQLFNFAAALAVAQRNGASVVIDTSDVGEGRDPHGFSISRVFSTVMVVDTKSEKKAKYLARKVLLRLGRNTNFMRAIIRATGHFESNRVGFEPKLLSNHQVKHIYGYYQCYNYFDTVKDRLISLYQESTEYSTWVRQLNDSLRLTIGRNIGIHIRLGDYLNEDPKLGILPPDYYCDALQAINPLADDIIWVFSDEPERALALHAVWMRDRNIKLVKNPPSATPADSLFLMSKMDTLIIANSSFSWWAASLSTSIDTVYAPKPWFEEIPEPENIRSPQWHTLPVQWNTNGTC
jgi:hypothetical protein